MPLVTTLQQNFEDGTVGANVTTSSTNGDSQTPMAPTLGTGATITFVGTPSNLEGTLSAKVSAPSGSNGFLTISNLPAGYTKYGFSARFNLPTVAATFNILQMRGASGGIGQAQWGLDRKMRFAAPGGTILTTSAITTPAKMLIEIAVDTGSTTTDGKIRVSLKDATSGAYLGGMSAPFESTSYNTGAGAEASLLQIGKLNAVADSSDIIFDDLKIVLGAYAFPSELGSLPPTADAGGDQVVEPWTTVTLDPSKSIDPSGAGFTAYTWTQTGGITVGLTDAGSGKRTFSSPPSVAGGDLIFNLTVTNSSGTSVADTVVVNVMPVTERIVVAGVEVPLRKLAVSA